MDEALAEVAAEGQWPHEFVFARAPLKYNIRRRGKPEDYRNFLTELQRNKKEENDDLESLLRPNWLRLEDELKSPVYAFQDIYFDHATKKEIVSHVGEKLAHLTCEILSNDAPISEKVTKYIRREFSEARVPNQTVDLLVEKFLSVPPLIGDLLLRFVRMV